MQKITDNKMWSQHGHSELMNGLCQWKGDILNNYARRGYVSRKEQRQLMKIEKTIRRLLKVYYC